jgi:hypothetical protein
LALYDSDFLLEAFRDEADRPDDDEDLTDAKVYRYLTRAQVPVYSAITARFPRLLMGAPALMSSSDGGYTYTVGTDSEGSTIYPFGHAEVYSRSLNGAELYGSTYGGFNGDVVFEGSKIRIPAGNTKTFASGPYIRYVALPLTISDSVEPTLQPKQIRGLILQQALILWANSGGHRDPRPYEENYQREWMSALELLTTQYKNSMDAALAGVAWFRWWLANGGSASHTNDG